LWARRQHSGLHGTTLNGGATLTLTNGTGSLALNFGFLDAQSGGVLDIEGAHLNTGGTGSTVITALATPAR